MDMGKIIAVANQKGGVGKTTSCVNLCAALAKRNRKVLLADCDPQGNSTSGMGVSKEQAPNVYDLLVRGADAADSVLIPVQCEYYALEGIADLMTTIKLTKKRLNPELEIQGIVLTMYDGRTNFSEQVAAEVEKFFGSSVYKTRIPRNVRIAEAPSHGEPVIKYDRISKGSRAYLHLADEFIRREE